MKKPLAVKACKKFSLVCYKTDEKIRKIKICQNKWFVKISWWLGDYIVNGKSGVPKQQVKFTDKRNLK